MAVSEKRKIGDIGEAAACRYLVNKGYVVIARNYWKPWGEIDIVTEKDKKLIFVEVKSVSRESAGWQIHPEGALARDRSGYRPEENFHPAKLKRFHRAIQTYLIEHKVPETKPWQIDLACVYLDFSTKKATVELLENIVL